MFELANVCDTRRKKRMKRRRREGLFNADAVRRRKGAHKAMRWGVHNDYKASIVLDQGSLLGLSVTRLDEAMQDQERKKGLGDEEGRGCIL